MEAKPLRAVSGRKRDDGNGGDGDVDDKKSMAVVDAEREGSGPEPKRIGAANLGLRTEVVPKLTVSQVQELKQQMVILKYLESGIAVPPVLLYPIRNSVAAAASCASANCRGGNDHLHIHCHGQFSYSAKSRPLGFDFKNIVDSEPGRCRRTDGKKWRCSKRVLTDTKYCERHVHRGRQRSRKLVETSQTGSVSDKPEQRNSSSNSANFVASYLNLMPMSPSPKIPSPSDSSFTHTIGSTSMACCTVRTSISAAKGNPMANMDTSSCFVDSSSVAYKNSKSNSICINHPDINNKHGEHSNSVAYSTINLKTSEPSVMKASTRTASTGLDFSPKSVLQDCSAPCYYGDNLCEEPQRCRRTDGKKWQCRKNVVPNQKYCERHMHRGVKKHIDAPGTTSFLTPDFSKSGSSYPSANSNNTTNCSRLNPNFFVSPEERPDPITAPSTSSTSSDTTISDTLTAPRRSK